MIHYVIRGGENYNSSASYNRVRLICDGLQAQGVEVKLHILYFKPRMTRVINIIERYVFSYFRHLLQLLHILNNLSKADVLIIYDLIDQFWMFRLFARKTNVLVELTEYPYYEINDKIRKIDTFYNKHNIKSLKYVSSVLTCSTYLADYYSKYVTSICIIPLVVNLDEYSNRATNQYEELGEYIAYCGNFNNNKDGVPILVEAFKLFHDKHPQVKLVLIGSGADANVKKITNLLTSFDLMESVILTGIIPHCEVCKWLTNATMLALARPMNRQAEGGIPSKVGEYLASGTPSVITKTGDLPRYLHDGIDCFLCEPDSATLFAKRLEECYQSDREMIGKMALEAAKQFDHITQANRLIEYLETKYNIVLKNK